jgi:minor histocompatibility antigen H13
MSEPGFLAQLVGRLAFAFAEVQPFLPTYLHIILSAVFPIFAASHASLSRPASAAKSKKGDPATQEDDEEEEKDDSRMEGLAPSDAIFFPLYAGLALTSLYYLIKWLEDPAVLNKILNAYFGVVGFYGVCKFISDALHVGHAFIFPAYYVGGAGLWSVDQTNRQTVLINGVEPKTRSSPLPGLLALIPLPNWILNRIWAARSLTTSSQKLTFRFYLRKMVAIRTHFDALHVLGLSLGFASMAYFNFIDKKWWLTNLMGFSFSYSALQLMSPTSFTTGGMLLVGLFLYDIYMVFFTPMMVTVAKSLDIPIKLLFPRPSATMDQDIPVQEYAMLGLGDIVLPGLLIALALRYDLYLHYLRLQTKQTSTPADEKESIVKAPYASPSKHWSSRFWTGRGAALPILSSGSFKKTYFAASLTGYIAGMIATLAAMHFSAHAQPALLYLVPGVLGSLVFTAIVRGEAKLMWNFSEEEEVEEEDTTEKKGSDEAKKAPKSKRSIFSLFRDETDSPMIRAMKESLTNEAENDTLDVNSTSQPARAMRATKRSARIAKKQEAEANRPDVPVEDQGEAEHCASPSEKKKDLELIHFSISTYAVPKGSQKKNDSEKKPSWIESKAAEKDGGLETGHVAKKLRTA